MEANTNETIIASAAKINPESKEFINGKRLDIFVFDLDGTTIPESFETPSKPGTTLERYFQDNPELPKKFQNALDSLMEANGGNIHFVIATGRGQDFAKRAWDYLTSFQEKYKVKALALETGAYLSVDGWNHVIDSPTIDPIGLSNIRNPEYRDIINNYVSDLKGTSESKRSVLCYNVPRDENGHLMTVDEFHRLLDEKVKELKLSGLEVAITSANSVEIIPKGASKSNALKYIFENLSDKNKYSHVTTFLCCDSANDLPPQTYPNDIIRVVASPGNSSSAVREKNIKKLGYYSNLPNLEGTIDNLHTIAVHLRQYNENAKLKNQILSN